MAVLDPLKVVITNYPEGKSENMETENNPEDPEAGTRMVPFSRELFIEKDDFMVDPPKKFFRLGPGREVRLKGAYIVKCEDYITNDNGEVTEIYCSYDPESRSGGEGSKRKVKGTLHWVSAQHAIDAEVRLFDRLFMNEDPNDVPEGEDFKANLNPHSLEIKKNCKLEPGLKDARPGEKFQFQRIGYFCADPDSTADMPVFNRTVPLRDSWSKQSR